MQTSYKGIHIRTTLRPGDIGFLTYLHGLIYYKECGYGLRFESYVAQGLCEFYTNYNADRDCVWICEKDDNIIGSLVLMHRDDNMAQLRYFLLLQQYRSIGLGGHLFQLFMEQLHQKKYRGAYLHTTDELQAAASLYKGVGFQLVQEIDSAIFDKPVKEQRYELIL